MNLPINFHSCVQVGARFEDPSKLQLAVSHDLYSTAPNFIQAAVAVALSPTAHSSLTLFYSPVDDSRKWDSVACYIIIGDCYDVPYE